MEKNKILSKLNISIKDYNNELEKILENKLFSYEVKNLLLSMLYKIENAYRDYETVKVEAPAKKDYIENLLRIIKEKCLKILLVKAGTPEAEELEQNNIKYKIDKKNGEIVCFQNELVILTAILKLDETDIKLHAPYEYLEEPLNCMLNSGSLDSNAEVIRDFNGWSWDIVINEINDIEYNFIYQTLLLLNGRRDIISRKHKEMYDLVCRMAIEKYISADENKEFKKNLEKTKKEKKDRLKLFENKKDFLDKVTQEKKEYMKEIEKIDKTLNNNEMLKKEYYSRNEKLPNRKKIFSANYLVKILERERTEFIEKIEECNKVILPKEFIAQKSILEEENSFLEKIAKNMEAEEIANLADEFISNASKKIDDINEENKLNLVKWMYKIRYYRFIPIDRENCVKDIKELEQKFDTLFKKIVKKARALKIIDVFTEDEKLAYEIVKEIFDLKINLSTINLQCNYENEVLTVEYYDDTVLEKSMKINIKNVRIKKKCKLFC